MPQSPRAEARSNQSNANNRTTDRLASMAHETIDRVAETAHHAEQEVRSAAARTAEKAKDVQEQAAAVTDQGLDKIRSYVEQNPIASAGIAFACGVLLSAVMRR